MNVNNETFLKMIKVLFDNTYLYKGPSEKRTQELFQHIRNWLRIITVTMDMIHLQYS